MAGSHFNAAHPTRFLIHGWTENGDAILCTLGRQAYMDGGHIFNVIIVDWGAGAQTDYYTARRRVEKTAQVVAQFIDWLTLTTEHDFKHISVIGFSLGAHVSGIAGKRLTLGRLASIVGLDSAKPDFDHPDRRLASTDADYVQVIHTDTDCGSVSEHIGHASFFPNWGRDQPGCESADTAITLTTCDHYRAVYLFVESIRNPDAFWATQCGDSYDDAIKAKRCGPATGPDSRMGGEPLTKTARGVYYVATNSESPFGQGKPSE